MTRRIVLLAGPGESTRIVYHALADEFEIAKVIIEDAVPRWEFLRRRARRYGVRKVCGQILFVALVVPYLRLEARERIAQIKEDAGLRDDPIDATKILRVSSANGPECRAALQRLAPDVVVVNGTRILTPKLLESITVPFVNIHAGITPKYRGVHGGYWALAMGDSKHCGVTVHRVDAGIDTGQVLAQENIDVTPADNFLTYPLLQLSRGLAALIAVLKGDLKGAIPAPTESQLFSHPTVLQYLRARFALHVR